MTGYVCVKPIRSEDDYEEALAEIEALMGSQPGTEEFDRLEILSTLVQAYERAHHPVDAPDPIEAILYFMESRGLTRKDLEALLNVSSGRVSELLNRKRTLTLGMIRKLHLHLGIPTDALIQEYALTQDEASGRELELKPDHEGVYALASTIQEATAKTLTEYVALRDPYTRVTMPTGATGR